MRDPNFGLDRISRRTTLAGLFSVPFIIRPEEILAQPANKDSEQASGLPVFIYLNEDNFNSALLGKFENTLNHIYSSLQYDVSEINVVIQSGGGLVDVANAVFNILIGLPQKVVTWNIGAVQSGAVLVFLA